MKLLIIGNSAASTAAIEAIRKYDRQSSIIQLSEENQPLYSRCLLSYYLAGSIGLEKLMYRDTNFHKEMDVQLHKGSGFRVVEVNPEQKKVSCENGDSFNYDRLLIATGSSAKLPDNIPKNVEGIYVLRNLADAEIIKKKLSNAKKAVVLGGGLIGMKAASALKEFGLQTTIVIRSSQVLSQMIDSNAARIIGTQMTTNKIELLLQTDITEIMSKEGKLCGIKTSQGTVIDCDVLIVAKGVNPNTDFIKSTNIEIKWGIKTDSFMQTSQEGIYAAGDVAEAYDIAIEDHTVNALWTCAVQQGRIAGFNMIDKQTAYNGAIGMNSLNIFNTPLISFGITSPKDESNYEILIHHQPEQNLYRKVVIDKDHFIKGIILLGNNDNAGVFLSVIQRKINVSGFKDELLSDRFNFATLLKYCGRTEFKRYYNAGQ